MRFDVPIIGTGRRLLRDSGGAAALIFALAVPVMLGFLGLGVEVGSWLWQTRAMQGAADAAAVSAAYALTFGTNAGNPNAFRTEGRSVAAVNGWTNGTNGIAVTVNNPPVSGAYTGNTAAVEVIITQTATNWFSGFLAAGYAAPQLKARSVALSNPAIDCILSLSNANTIGVNFDVITLFGLLGGVNMPNCSIGDNARGPSALAITGVTTTVTAYTATVYGDISTGLLDAFNFTRAPAKNSKFITPDPYRCPGAECRTMPTPSTPTAIAPVTAIAPLASTPYPGGTCSPGTTITNGMTLGANGCYKGPRVTTGVFNITAPSGSSYTIISPTGGQAGPAINVTGGILNISGGGNLMILGDFSRTAISASGGNVNISVTGSSIIQGGSSQPAILATGGNVAVGGTFASILSGQGAAGINITRGSVNLSATTSNIQGAQSGTNNHAISVGGGTVTIGGTTASILGGAGGAGIRSTAGTLTLNAATDKIQGGSGNAGLAVSGGTVTIGSTTDSIRGGTNGAGINLSAGTVNVNAPGNTVQGGSSNAAIQIVGSTPTLTFGPGDNRILAGAGSPAITVAGTSFANNARLIFGNGNNNIQGAAADNGSHSAMTITGRGDVTFGDGNTTFGGPTVTPNVPAVNDDAGFGANPNTHLGLTLGSGTFQFMEGLTVTGGNLTLNPSNTGIGYYIMNGGSNGGLNMTFGDLIGTNATIVLTGSGSDYANLNINGIFDGMTLTAPTTGPTAGIAIFQDRNAPAGNTNYINGASFDNITGAIYTPSQTLQFTGLAAMNSPCTQLIASTIKIVGLTSIDDQCEGTGVAPIGGNGAITLVE